MKIKKAIPICVVSILILALLTVFSGCTKQQQTPSTEASEVSTTETGTKGAEPEIPSVPVVEVSFGHEPYMDHTQLIIALDKGWTKDVGVKILPDPNGKVIPAENCIPVFASGEVDVISASVPLFLGGSKQMPKFKFFFGATIFQGYAIMAQPDAGYKSVQEFVLEGMAPDAALKAAVEQMRGKKFAYPAEAAVKGFIDLSLKKGGLTLKDTESVVAEDSKTTAMMIAKRADFQVGGVPSRLTLESEGFKPIITSADLAQNAKASPDSEELRAIFLDGWVASDDYIADNYDTVLRMASIGWRINQTINEKPQDVIKTHLNFLNSKAGTNLSEATGNVIYTSLCPFITFKDQAKWFDDNNAISDNNIIGSYIKMWEEKGYFKAGEVKPSDFSIASKVYADMTQYKADTDAALVKAKALISDAKSAGKDLVKATEMVTKAEFYYGIFDFLDSSRFAKAAVTWAEYEAK